jgi:hypothetical protein
MNRAKNKQQKLEEKRARKAVVVAGTIESGEATGSEESADGADTKVRPAESGGETDP